MRKAVGCAVLCHAELQAVLQLCCTKLGAWGVRAEALNLIAMVIRIMSGRRDWHLPAGPHVVQGACSLT